MRSPKRSGHSSGGIAVVGHLTDENCGLPVSANDVLANVTIVGTGLATAYTKGHSPIWWMGISLPWTPLVRFFLRPNLPLMSRYATALRRAVSRNHEALILGVRFNVFVSTRNGPNLGWWPKIHSRLSIVLQWNHPRTGTP
jgi:hypothetical protein